MFFSLAKVAKARQRAAEQEEADLQYKLNTEDKKLQAVIMREEKAQKTAEKKIRRENKRIAAREELTRKKT